MKKIYSLAAAALLTVAAIATTPKSQTNLSGHTKSAPAGLPSTSRIAFTCDTLTNVDDTDTLTLYTLGTGGADGYVSGTNNYDDKAKADFFTTTQPNGTITDVLFYFGAAAASNSTTSFNAKVWSDNMGMPDLELQSESYLFEDAANDVAANSLSFITFTNPVAIPGNFYVGIEFPTGDNGDTIALVTNQIGESSPGTAWEKWSDDTWYAYADTNTYGIDVSHVIVPVLCDNSTGVASVDYDKSVAVYPTSANDFVNLLVTASADVKVQIVDVKGNVVVNRTINTSANHLHQFDVTSLSNGSYMMNISYGNYSSTKRFSVVR